MTDREIIAQACLSDPAVAEAHSRVRRLLEVLRERQDLPLSHPHLIAVLRALDVAVRVRVALIETWLEAPDRA